MTNADAEQYRRASEIFLVACELSPPQQQEFLQQNCDDAEMLVFVQSMLDRDSRLGSIDKGSIDRDAVACVGENPDNTGLDGNDETLRSDQTIPNVSASTPRSATGRDKAGLDFDDYEDLKEIAHGGMGIIYQAHQRSLNREVAIKMIRPSAHLSTSDLERFHLEAEAAAQLDHPNIIPIYEIGDHEGQPFFSMKLIEGGNLSSWLKEGHDIRERVAVLTTTALAVHHAHQNGVLHRDIKPANILIDSNDEPHIGDFGLAKQLDTDVELTVTGQIIGTPGYLSPEQARGQNATITTATDIYSLGAVLYVILTGGPPFKSESIIDTLRQIVDQVPPRPSQSNPNVDLDLETICLRCLEKSPTDRYASAEALASELQRWSNGEPILSRPITSVERLLKWARRKPVPAALSAAMMLMFVIASSVIVWKWRDAEYQRGEVIVQQRQTRQYLYIAHMNLAQQAWENGMVQEVRRLLDQHVPTGDQDEIRTFEWYYYDRLCRQVLATPSLDYGDIVTFVAASPKGDELAAAGDDEEIQIWDLASNQRKYNLSPKIGNIKRLHFSATGNDLVATARNQFRVWTQSQGRLEESISGTTVNPYRTKLSHDGRWLAVPIQMNQVQIWNLEDPTQTRTLPSHDGGVLELAFLRDNRHLISATKNSVRLWDVRSGNAVAEVRATELNLQGSIHSFALSGDDATVAVVADNAIHLYRVSPEFEWSLHRELGKSPYRIDYLLPLGDGGVFACVASDAVTLREFETGTRCGLLDDPTTFSTWLDSSADGSRIATIGSGNIAHLWEATSGTAIGKIYGHGNVVYAMDLADNGTVVTGGRDQTIRISDPSAAEVASTLRGHEGRIWSTNFSMDGDQIASGSSDGTVKIWDMKSASETWKIDDSAGSIQFVIYSPDRRTLAAASRDSTIRLIDMESRTVIGTLEDHDADVNSLSFSSDGRYLASGSNDGSVIIWDVTERSAKHRLATLDGDVWAVAFSPDDRSVVFGGRSKQIQIWDLPQNGSTKTDPATLIAQLETDVTSLMFSPDGKTLSATIGSGAILLFDYPSRQLVKELTGHSSDAMSTSFSPDGTTLVSGCSDGKIRFWNLSTHQRTIAIQGHPQHIHCVRFSPDGSSVASASWDGTIRVWSATKH